MHASRAQGVKNRVERFLVRTNAFTGTWPRPDKLPDVAHGTPGFAPELYARLRGFSP